MQDERLETVGGALRGVFGDPSWLKNTGIALLVMLIPYVGQVWFMGYAMRYQRDLAWRRSERLPNWSDAGGQIKTGFFGMIVGFVYTLPVSLLMTMIIVPITMLPMMSLRSGEQWLAPMLLGTAAAMLASMLLGVLMYAILYPAYLQVALYDTIESGFRLKEIFGRARDNSPAYWSQLWRSVGLGLLSAAVVSVVIGALSAIGVAAVWAAAPGERAFVLGSLLMYPLIFVASILVSVIVIPLSLANYRLWASYARVAYGLEVAAV